jgi:hypothetical protein
MSKVELCRPKTGGRQRGTPNRVTADVRQAFARLVGENLADIQRWLDRVAIDDPARALELVLQISRYVLPELKAVGIEIRDRSPDVRRLSMAELTAIVREESPEAVSDPSRVLVS